MLAHGVLVLMCFASAAGADPNLPAKLREQRAGWLSAWQVFAFMLVPLLIVQGVLYNRRVHSVGDLLSSSCDPAEMGMFPD
jgi:hypothetical protein